MDRYAITTSGFYNYFLGEWCKAADVDAMLSDVRALVELIKDIKSHTSIVWPVEILKRYKQAIAAIERHLDEVCRG